MQQIIRDGPGQPPVGLRLTKILTDADISEIIKDNAIIQELADYFHCSLFDDVCGKNKIEVNGVTKCMNKRLD